MRKGFMVSMMVLLMMAVAAFPAYAAARPNVIVSGFEAAPEVGKDFTLKVTLTNAQPNTCAENILASVAANSPFIMEGLNKVAAKNLCGGESAVVEFPMRIDPTATGGTYQITVTSNYETSTFIQFSGTDVLNVFVEGTPEIKAAITDSQPVDIYPGDTATVTFTIENAGSFEAQSVGVSLKGDAPVEVKWAHSFNALGVLDAKSSKNAAFSVEVPKDAEAKDYPMSLEITYLDEKLQQRTVTQTFMLHVEKKAMFRISDSHALFYQNDNSKNVELMLRNTGTDTAYKIKAKLLPQFPFSSDGSVRYVEKLEPGQIVGVLLTLNVDKDGTPGDYGLDMLFDFEDAQGKRLQDTAKLSLAVQQKDWSRAVFIDYVFGWILLAVAALILIIRKMKGKKK